MRFGTRNFVFMRHVLALGLTFLVFLGNIGLPVYSHSCMTAGATYRSIGLHSDECKSHEDQAEKIPSCCHKPKTVEKHSCCSESVKRLALSFPYVHQLSVSPCIIPSTAIAVFGDFVPRLSVRGTTGLPSNRPPPWIAVNRYLSAICVWRI